MSDIKFEELSRNQLKKLISANKLGISVMKTMTDDELRVLVKDAMSKLPKKTPKETPKEEEKAKPAKTDEVIFMSTYPSQWIGNIKFEKGLYITSNPEEIKKIKSNNKFGRSIRIQKVV
jgi:hypothetical protein